MSYIGGMKHVFASAPCPPANLNYEYGRLLHEITAAHPHLVVSSVQHQTCPLLLGSPGLLMLSLVVELKDAPILGT